MPVLCLTAISLADSPFRSHLGLLLTLEIRRGAKHGLKHRVADGIRGSGVTRLTGDEAHIHVLS